MNIKQLDASRILQQDRFIEIKIYNFVTEVYQITKITIIIIDDIKQKLVIKPENAFFKFADIL